MQSPQHGYAASVRGVPLRFAFSEEKRARVSAFHDCWTSQFTNARGSAYYRAAPLMFTTRPQPRFLNPLTF